MAPEAHFELQTIPLVLDAACKPELRRKICTMAAQLHGGCA
eukprot:CAMPEP_0204230918 /NCGR_PEP_ID=MMETSP0361-20130328/88341_1 /ASSEMBLY_ACC=CAM_ASM_000343 /TAXON_ID=268821 /ORGANISM="Scrippsiella Hangoei, Strain SHTV-5" /LENGTH=40 /DNA_ID= /DNA_START= /DNA_END= /DNA_ORIENTATION=